MERSHKNIRIQTRDPGAPGEQESVLKLSVSSRQFSVTGGGSSA
jgi:hypothetical protein